LEAYEHQDLPLELLIERLQPRRDPSRTPLFQVMFVLQNNQMPDVGRHELTLDGLDGGGRTDAAKFDLSLILAEGEEGIAGGLEYNTDLFDPATISRLACHFRALLDAVVAGPDRRLSGIPLIEADERRRLIDDWGRGAERNWGDRPIHERIEAQAR